MSSEPTAAERACFEAGIKFGSLYHQFAGTPVSPSSAASLARAMERAIQNQPHCVEVSVTPDRSAIEMAAVNGYTELTGRFLDVSLTVEVDGITVTASMAMEDDYPLMQIDSVTGR